MISAAIGSPIVLGLNNTPDRVADACLFYNSDFIIYSSLSSFYIPCIIMVFLYYNIFRVSTTIKTYSNLNSIHKTTRPDETNVPDVKYKSVYSLQDKYKFKSVSCVIFHADLLVWKCIQNTDSLKCR